MSDTVPDCEQGTVAESVSAAELAVTDKKPEPTKTQAKPRLYVLDNAKFFLTLGVVGTHLGGPFIGLIGFFSYYQAATFVFLMPVFACISGYCSSPDFSHIRKVDGVIKVVAIYVLAQTLYLLLIRFGKPLLMTTYWGHDMYACNGIKFTNEFLADGNRWKLADWLQPFWLLWYLFDLAVWRVMLPFWSRLRYPLVCAVFWGPFVATFWNCGAPWETIFGYWPLYVLGAQAKQQNWQLWPSSVVNRLLGLAILVSMMLFPIFTRMFYIDPDVGPLNLNGEVWHFGNDLKGMCYGDGYKCLSLRYATRLLVSAGQALAVWGFLHVVPHCETPIITSFGERSLVNYIFHPISGLVVSWIGVYGTAGGTPANQCPTTHGGPHNYPSWGPPVLILFMVLQGVFLMSPWVWKVVWPICDPPIHWVLKPQQ